jgi:hypothetical protein
MSICMSICMSVCMSICISIFEQSGDGFSCIEG